MKPDDALLVAKYAATISTCNVFYASVISASSRRNTLRNSTRRLRLIVLAGSGLPNCENNGNHCGFDSAHIVAHGDVEWLVAEEFFDDAELRPV